MPVRLWTSSVLKWPDAPTVLEALRQWAERVRRPDVLGIGYCGSYSRGDWGVGSDLDMVILLERTDAPPERRAAEWDVTDLPVPADVLVYSPEEWERLPRRLREETVWVYRR
ncbi:MAG: nucleotidyltransferase domain-containing protein [Thermoflexales bacterium]|nr:nucleotidyltransferase domain-containing protein [Thermoflexales bacterium]